MRADIINGEVVAIFNTTDMKKLKATADLLTIAAKVDNHNAGPITEAFCNFLSGVDPKGILGESK